MLLGKQCKVGSGVEHKSESFTFYSGVIVSEPALGEDGDFRVLVLTEGRLKTADTYYVYDIETVKEVAFSVGSWKPIKVGGVPSTEKKESPCSCILNLETCNC